MDEARLERVARGIAHAVATRALRDDRKANTLTPMQRAAAITTMIDGMWKDLLIEAEGAINAYPEPVSQ